VEGQDIPPSPPHGLREVYVLLVAGETMQKQDSRMETRTRRGVENRVEIYAATGDRAGQRLCGAGSVYGRVTRYRALYRILACARTVETGAKTIDGVSENGHRVFVSR